MGIILRNRRLFDYLSCSNSVYVASGDKFRMIVATTLREDGFAESSEWTPLDTGPSKADSFEYVMFGKIYRIDGEDVTEAITTKV